MYIETERFGSFEMDDDKIIHFPQGLPGLEELKRYIIVKVEETEPIYWLQSVDEKYIALPVIVPFEIKEDYFIQIRDKELNDLKVVDQNDLLIMNVVVIPEEFEKMTANLAAPIIINAKEGLGKQIIVDAKELPVRFPIYESVMYALKGGAEDASAIEENR